MKKIHGIILIIIGILVDQVSKIIVFNNQVNFTVIPNLINFTLVNNYGAAFGSFQGANYILAGVSVLVCIVMIGLIAYMYHKGDKVSFAYYLIIAGGIGNFIDRIARGFVVDFIDTPFIATFNIADSFIVIGAFWIMITEVLKSLKIIKE
ncbi:MAG: signal peptidase II [Clostridia bacterium]|nr:signal peptidase II [Clostridia bacterium]